MASFQLPLDPAILQRLAPLFGAQAAPPSGPVTAQSPLLPGGTPQPLDPNTLQRLAQLGPAVSLQRVPTDTPLQSSPAGGASRPFLLPPLSQGGVTPLQNIPTTLDATNGQLPRIPTSPMLGAGSLHPDFSAPPQLLSPGTSMTATPQPLGMPAPQLPNVQRLPTQTDIDQNELQRLRNSGSGIDQMGKVVDPTTGVTTPGHLGFWGALGKVAATVGDDLLRIGAPGVEPMVPGGYGAHQLAMRQRQGYLNNDLADEQQRAQTAQTHAQTGLLNVEQQYKPIQLQNAALLNQAKIDHFGAQDQNYTDKVTTAAAEHGLKPDGKGGFVPMSYAELSPTLQRMEDYKAAQTEYQQAQAALKTAQNDPSSPVYRLAKQRADTALQNANTALQRLAVSQENLAFNQDKFYEPQPTAMERNKGDLAQSALERVQEMRHIIAKHPEAFGPLAGRSTNAQQWLGSQDPDAQTYLSAAQYLADHSAGVFGGRGQYILSQLHSITDPHSNPAALNAALDEAERAAQGFVRAGAVHGRGGHSGYAAPPNAGAPPQGATMKVPGADGHLHWSDGRNDLGIAQ